MRRGVLLALLFMAIKLKETEADNQVPCSAGEFRNASEEVCTACPDNQYSSAGATVCLDCEVGKVHNSAKSGCVQCSAGEFRSASEEVCTACPDNHHSSAGATVCLDCDVTGCVHGGWSGYGEWSDCSTADCGTQTRRRTCTRPTPANGGEECVGRDTENEYCNSHYCPDTERVPGEIRPVSAEQSSHTPHESAWLAIDRNISTSSGAEADDGGKTWLKVHLGQVNCVDKVIVYWNTSYQDNYSYSCSQDEDECTCEGKCRGKLVSVYNETTNTTPGTILSTTGCRLGDTVQLYSPTIVYIRVAEVVITAKLADCTALNTTWESVVTVPPLPVEHSTAIVLGCRAGHINTGGIKASCQNGTVDLSDEPPFCDLDLGENKNLISNFETTGDWKDNDTGTCADTTESEFTIEFSGVTSDCPGGKCRVNYILLYPDSVEFTSLSWVDTADQSHTTLKGDLEVDTNNITIPDNVLLKRLTINFGTETSLCEIVIAGTPTADYDCTEGYFYDESVAQCRKCAGGTYADVSGRRSCEPCPENKKTPLSEGNIECKYCDYLQYSTKGSADCQNCDEDSDNPACFLDEGTNINRVSSSFGNAELRSFVYADSGNLQRALGSMEVDLEGETSWFVFSVVLIFEDPLIRDVALPMTWADHPSCSKSTSTVPDDTLLLVCSKSQTSTERFTFELKSVVRLKKLFVFGILFNEALAPRGYKNDGTQFLECQPGHYSLGGVVTQCTACLENQYQPATGGTSCENCAEEEYSSRGAATCKTCEPGSENAACVDLNNVCQVEPELNLVYGPEPYTWPITVSLTPIPLPCYYNPEEEAYKSCTKNNGKYRYEATDFSKCKSKLTDDINKIDTKSEDIDSEDTQEKISKEIKDITAGNNSEAMNAGDVEKTSNIINNLLNYTEGRNLPEQVKENILVTVNSVHKSTKVEEMARGHAASKMRGSVKKLSNEISKDTSSASNKDYICQSTVAVAISKPVGDSSSTSFSIVGEKGDFNETEKKEGLDSGKSLLFSAEVPADKESRAVTAILYDTPNFYPDNFMVPDVGKALAQQFSVSRPKETGKLLKVISMVTEISYAENENRVDFVVGEAIKLAYAVKGDKPTVHYKMALKQNYECAYYDTTSTPSKWITGDNSGCTMGEIIGEDGESTVSCDCNHMTSFAVLMSFSSDYDPAEEIVSQVLLAISLGCLFCTIIAYLPAKELLKTRTVRLNLLLVTSMIFSIIIFYFMEVVITTNVNEGNVPSDKDTASIECVIIAFLMNYFWLCQMAWMVCEAVVMYRALVSCVVNSHIHRYMLKFNLVCWGIPLVFPIAGVIWGQTDFADPQTCFLRVPYGYATFYAPVVACVLFNIVIFIRITWTISRNQNNMAIKIPVSDLERRKKQFKSAVTVMSLLGVAWVFGFLLIMNKTNVIWLRYLFIIFNATQGIFIFVLYVVLNDGLRKVWKKLLGMSDGDKPSHSSVPNSKSKGQKTKQTTLGASNTKSMSEMDPLSTTTLTTTSRSAKTTTFPMDPVQESGVHIYDSMSEMDPLDTTTLTTTSRSTKMTTSLLNPVQEGGNMDNSSEVHIYDSMSEMDPLSTTTTSQSARLTGKEKMVQEIDRSRSSAPRSTKMTTSLMDPVQEGVKMHNVNSSGVHIYDNVASVIGDALTNKMQMPRRQNSGSTFSDFNEPSTKKKKKR